MPTLTKITASDGDIDTSDQLVSFEAYGKRFFVNGVNLKVADFINCELTHAALATAHAKGDILTQATSAAAMVVDFTNTAKTKTYGYVTTSAAFNTTNEVTGSGSGTAFTPSATDTGSPGSNQPHWYDWTVYPGGASGAMPAKAYLGCLYRGRGVLSGNPNYPHQWYMSRQGDLWDWAYTANDAQTPIAGNNADAGEIGDIIKALIPYRDEYLVFGCADSIWVLKGDAAEGGALQEVDLTKGMFGAKSWAFDGDGNLFFASLTGFHMLPVGFGPIRDISNIVLPNLSIDETLDPAIHRITVEYDHQNTGILFAITDIVNGTNSNYWYSLKTNGFFPESYDSTCSPYSLFFYDSTDDGERSLILGCKDGYLREFSRSTKNDTTTASTATITSYVTLPVMHSEDDDSDLKINSTTVTMAGGKASGDAGDSDGVDIEMYSAKDDETVIEDIVDGETPLHNVTISLDTGGSVKKLRNRIKGHSIAFRLHNDTASQTWAIEKVSTNLKEIR